ncbi:MAG: imidazole glycerol phosphate synthase subunit HisF [Hyphomicrobiaceae bacterium]
MLKTRIIPVLFLMNGLIVRSERFTDFKVIGNPLSELERYSEWLADELIYIDITREGEFDLRRSDHKIKNVREKLDLLGEISRHAFMPLTFGGRIETLQEIDDYLEHGADKVVLNSIAWKSPALIETAATKHGSQAIVVGLDVKREDGELSAYVDQGRTRLSDDPATWARRVEAAGAGEILINSIDRDGMAEGYDIEAVRLIADMVKIPVIACGGAGDFSDFLSVLVDGNASAVSAGNIFHFTEHSYKRAKTYLRDRNINVRYPY